MGLLEDILNALDRFDLWQRIKRTPDQIESLAKRIEELESKLGGKYPPDICKFCGARAARLYHSFPANDKGIVHQEWSCTECKRTETRSEKAR